ncbi:DNA replication/repair protein RecF [Lactococcus kimchii]|uniref:DNA replication/repair protein RecF n=1 Tax=Lactococcus sp. S-13 TaxID=2507158 RepID=UPI0010233123|nr:DNA replication/repair protein RecF [Lactococcus sp. S-13]RZI49136.1 DNA replication/repair protein RecF [Lactococcus sp. S-13]
MKLKQIELKNFRNYAELQLDFHPNLNIFLGQNAQGKTNILEAIHFLALTRSHRTSHDKELIRWSQKEMKVTGSVEKKHTTVPLEVQLTPKGRIAKANHLKENRLADYIGQLKILMFAPENLELVKGSPAIRRRFLDMELGQIHAVYLYDSMRYNRALKERNAYLKFDQSKIDKNFLSVLDEQLVEHGNKIMLERAQFIEKLEHYASKIHKQLTHGAELLTISYAKNVKTDFAKELLSRQDHDIFRHQTSSGPHRDDLQFFINDINVADFGSQGQQRTVALSIKLAEIDLIFDETGEYPILLLDDVMSELDNSRQLDLLETSLGKTQTFLTTTTLNHLKNLPENLSIFNVEKGEITQTDEKSY